MAWESLPIRKSGLEITSKKEGRNLPNSETEDICGFSLMPSYSAKQLRGIHRREIKKFRKETHQKFSELTQSHSEVQDQ